MVHEYVIQVCKEKCFAIVFIIKQKMKKLYHWHFIFSFFFYLCLFFSDALNSGGLLSPQTSIDKLCEVLTSKFESGAHIDFYDEIKQWTPLTGRLDFIYKLWNMNYVVHHDF